MSANSVDHFMCLLKDAPSGAVFNPWWQVDKENDIGPQAPRIRRKQLRAYVCDRLETARLAIIGEALGYRGGHFTGIPMTSERILLGRNKEVKIEAKHFFSDVAPQRTSKSQICQDGFSEPTATIVWGTLLALSLQPEQFILWNAFPWHSFDPRRGILSNRTPSKTERIAGIPVLEAFLALFPCDQVLALGRIATEQLADLNVDARYLRHPASGGARLFRAQIGDIAIKSV